MLLCQSAAFRWASLKGIAREEQGDGQFRYAARVGADGGQDGDAQPLGGCQVDVVDADTVAGDGLEGWRGGFQDAGADLLDAGEVPRAAGQFLQEFGLIRLDARRREDDLATRFGEMPEGRVARPGEGAGGDEDFRHRKAFSRFARRGLRGACHGYAGVPRRFRVGLVVGLGRGGRMPRRAAAY